MVGPFRGFRQLWNAWKQSPSHSLQYWQQQNFPPGSASMLRNALDQLKLELRGRTGGMMWDVPRSFNPRLSLNLALSFRRTGNCNVHQGDGGSGGWGGVDLTEGLKVFFLAIQGGSVLTIKQIKYMQYVVSLFFNYEGKYKFTEV